MKFQEIRPLKLEEVDGDYQLEFFKKKSIYAPASDFAIASGLQALKIPDPITGKSLITGKYWIHEDNANFYNAMTVTHGYGVGITDKTKMTPGIRLCMPFDDIIKLQEKCMIHYDDNNPYILYGEYPQTIADMKIAKHLDTYKKKNSNNIISTNDYFFVSNKNFYDHKTLIENLQPLKVYKYNNKKYACTSVNFYDKQGIKYFSNQEKIKENKFYWFKIEPVKWFIDCNSKMLISEQILQSGIKFSHYASTYNITELKLFIDKFMVPNMVKHSLDKNTNEPKNIEKTKAIPVDKKRNVYCFDYSKVSEEDIMKGAIESKISVFLHGLPGDGKSARVKELDPTCEIIYLRNTNLESLTGKSVYNEITGEMIDVPPVWYTNIIEKSKKEPDKIHLLFFDELTNVMPSVQGAAFNIILDREVNGIWRIPDNVRIVAAGNDTKDSTAASDLAEPLFDRFAHVYIKTSVSDWLDWAIKPDNDYKRVDYIKEDFDDIHPAIIDFIEDMGEEYLRSEYDGVMPNATPRKWEMASRILYKTNKPEMLRSLIGTKYTDDFINYCSNKKILIKEKQKGMKR